jgi:hypothetical protein
MEVNVLILYGIAIFKGFNDFINAAPELAGRIGQIEICPLRSLKMVK